MITENLHLHVLNTHFVANVLTTDFIYICHAELCYNLAVAKFPEGNSDFQPPEGHTGTVWQLFTGRETVTTALLLQNRFILRTL